MPARAWNGWLPVACQGLSVSQERRIPDEWEADWAASTGRDPQAHLQATHQQTDLVLRMQKAGRRGLLRSNRRGQPFPVRFSQKSHPAGASRRLDRQADGIDDRAG